MAVVKGSKLYEMRVVPHRPVYRAALSVVVLLVIGALVAVAYSYGHADGLALRAQVVQERDELETRLQQSADQVGRMRQELADLKIGRDIDGKANEHVRETVEGLQGEVAALQEEIRFYKGVMLPNADEKGLRIERLDLNYTADPNKVQYNLLLTQVVDKHEMVQGAAEINLVGVQGDVERTIALNNLGAQNEKVVRFRFRYFQNLTGELNLPTEFVPQEVVVIVQAAGDGGRKLERRFPWQLNEV